MADRNKRNRNTNRFQVYDGKSNWQSLLSSFATRVTGTSFSVQSSLPELPPAAETEDLLQHHLNMGSVGDGMLLGSSDFSIDEAPGGLNVKPKPKKRYLDSDHPLITWKDQHRDNYLDWTLTTEGRGRHASGICNCGSADANFRCIDCFSLQMACKTCIRGQHTLNPLHRIQEWKAGRFHAVPLKQLGIRVQLGHCRGERCSNPKQPQGEFVVLSLTGIHEIDLRFCGCEFAPDQKEQLLEVAWWPSSYKDPRTAATFDLLRHFQLVNLQGHTPTTDFYHALVSLYDGTGLTKPPDRLQQFRTMVRQWNHIKMAKRCGRGHDPSGLSGTKPGSAAVLCRACPQPGINLPDGWEKASAGKRWLYALILAMDANFKQKSRLRANDGLDPALGPGWACFVDHDKYMSIIGSKGHQDEISHCVGFNAIWNANSKKSKGLRATGIGSVTCARHELFRPNGTGDLQKGERYCNMDTILLMSIMNCIALMLFISYDIACQWYKNFFARMNAMPSWLHIPQPTTIRFKVPKFHLPAHVQSCHTPFAFNFTEGVGRTDGEAPERNWSTLNTVANSVSMMSAGARSDSIDEHCNFSNYKKTINLDMSLLKKLVKAIPRAIVNARAFAAFDEMLKVDFQNQVLSWEKQVVAWEQAAQGTDLECPYDRPGSVITVAKVKKQLAEEDLKKEIEGKSTDQSRASCLIIEGLEIEDVQQSIRKVASAKKRTEYQETNLLNRRTALLNRIRRFHDTQVAHIPKLSNIITPITPEVGECPENIILQLPSTLNAACRSLVYPEEFIQLEDRLRYAHAHESLSDLQNHLCSRSVAYTHSTRLVPSQGAYTKGRALRDQVEEKVKDSQLRYVRAHAALLSLRGQGDWTKVLRELKPEDVRGISERLLRAEEKQTYREAQECAGVSSQEIEALLNGEEGNVPTTTDDNILSSKGAVMSWIWLFNGEVRSDGEAKHIEAGLRVEWCKARARARRSREELQLVDEEMRRAIAFCYWRVKWWEEQATARVDVSPSLAEGLHGYAREQADIERERATAWHITWHPLRQRVQAILDILDNRDCDVDTLLKQLKTLTIELDIEDAVEELEMD